jgi:hypothetical protein
VNTLKCNIQRIVIIHIVFLILKELPSEWKVPVSSTNVSSNLQDDERSDESDDSDEDSTTNESMFDVLAPSDLPVVHHKRGTYQSIHAHQAHAAITSSFFKL